MTADKQPLVVQPTGTQRPTRADHRAFQALQAMSLKRALDDAKAWRNGYAMLAGGLGALLGFIGTQLSDATAAGWRIALSVLLGGGLVCVAAALLLTLTIEGGRRSSRLNLRQIVATYNSVEAFQAAQAAAALARLDRSKMIAALGAVLAFAGLLVTLWVPGPADKHPSPAPPPKPTASSTPMTSAPDRPGPSG